MRTLAAAVAALLALSVASAAAQGWQMPPESERCPSKWGKDDQRGTANMMTAQSVAQAAKLIKTGEVFELGAVLSPDTRESFINEGRQFNIYTKVSPPIPNARQVQEELVVTELGQIGTQIDAFSHQMWGDSFYNCFKLGEIGTRNGFKKLGVEHIGSLFTRGVLDRRRRPQGRRHAANLLHDHACRPAAGARQVGPEAAAGRHGRDPDRLVEADGQGQPALRPRKRWPWHRGGAMALTQNPIMVAADNCCIEVRPSEPGHSLPVHAMMIIQHGIYLLENLELEKLAAAGATEFAFIVQPLEDQGRHGLSGRADRGAVSSSAVARHDRA